MLIVLIIMCNVVPFSHAEGSADGFYEDARQRYYGGDPEAALVQLKNALQADSQHIPSLVLAGEIQMELVRPADADHQFSEALLLGADRDLLAPKLAEAYLMQGKYTDLIQQIPADGLSDLARLDVLVYRAEAYIALDNLNLAEEAIEEAHSIDAKALPTNIVAISLHVLKADYDEALQVGRKLVVDWPQEASAWTALGTARQAKGGAIEAIEAYSQALALDPKFDQARLGRVALLVDAERDDQAQIDLDILGNAHPLDPRLRYLRAQLLDRAGEHEAALKELKFAVEVMEALPPEKITNDPQLTLIAGLSHYGLGNYESARSYLDVYLRGNSEDAQVSMLLASILLQLDDALRAIKILTPLYKGDSNNPRILALLAAAYSHSGHYERAIQLLTRITDIRPNSAAFTDLARYRLSAGYTSEGLTALEHIVAEDANNVTASFSLAAAYLDMGRASESVDISGHLAESNPANPAIQNLYALALLADGKTVAAQEILNALVQTMPEFTAGKISLARVEIQLSLLDQAELRLQAILEEQKTNSNVMLELARVELARGNMRETIAWSEAAVREESLSTLEAKTFLIDVLLSMRDMEGAEDLASRMANGADEDLSAQAVFAQVLVQAGKPKAAATVYLRMQKLAGFNADKLYRIASLQAGLDSWDDAAVTLRKVLAKAPEHEAALLLYAQSFVVKGNFEQALAMLRKARAAHPGSTAAHGLYAETLARSGDIETADLEYRKVMRAGYDQRWLLGLFKVSLLRGKLAEAEALLRDTLQTHPGDIVVRMSLSDYLLGLQRWEEARVELAVLIERSPDDVGLLNNMAYVLNELNLPQSIEFARKAHKLAPEDGAVNDTLGWILVGSGRAEEGLPFLREASTRIANDPQVSYHLAVALHKLGRDAEAKTELMRALTSNPGSFVDREQAEALLENL
jgi:putative PEP-CTERM system TPR-repeat lipoprotein